MSTSHVPSVAEFKKGHRMYERRVERDGIYKTASFLIQHFWGQPAEIADGLGVLLLTWNQAFYRYGYFDLNRLERCIKDNQKLLNWFRPRQIFSLRTEDKKSIIALFNEFLAALRIAKGTKAKAQSPVAVAKALHLLAPAFFPLWDNKIAHAYDCDYTAKPAVKYVEFMAETKSFAEMLRHHAIEAKDGRSLLKLIDEYNYAKYTKNWDRSNPALKRDGKLPPK